MPTPYTTKSGVQIGIRYEPPKPRMSRDEEMIQRILLGEPHGRGGLSPWLIVAMLVLAYALVSCVK